MDCPLAMKPGEPIHPSFMPRSCHSCLRLTPRTWVEPKWTHSCHLCLVHAIRAPSMPFMPQMGPKHQCWLVWAGTLNGPLVPLRPTVDCPLGFNPSEPIHAPFMRHSCPIHAGQSLFLVGPIQSNLTLSRNGPESANTSQPEPL